MILRMNIDNALSDIAQPLPREFGVPAASAGAGNPCPRRMTAVVPNIRIEGGDRCGTILQFPNRRTSYASTSFGEYISAINDRVVHGSQHDRGDEQCRLGRNGEGFSAPDQTELVSAWPR